MMIRSIFAITMICGLVSGCVPDAPSAVAIPSVQSDLPPVATPVVAHASAASRADIGALLNAKRAEHGLPALSENPKLSAAARAHALDMARVGFFSHGGSNGSKPSTRVRAQGYQFCYVAENIAQGWHDASTVMQGWMDSPGHRVNNLSKEPREYGAARADGDYWVLVFGRDGCG